MNITINRKVLGFATQMSKFVGSQEGCYSIVGEQEDHGNNM